MEIKNRAAYYEYFIEDKYTAGMVLTGTEVKSLRAGRASFNDSYCIIDKGEAWIKSFHIAEYSHGTVNNHEPLRQRKLLLQKKELKKIPIFGWIAASATVIVDRSSSQSRARRHETRLNDELPAGG